MLLVGALALAACSTDGTASPSSTTIADSVPVSSTTPPTSPSTAPPTTPPTTSADGDDLAAALDDIASDGFEGVVAVRDGGDITARAYGLADRENDVPVDAETVFDIGSITKQFTAAAILRLQMDGRLSVDDTLGDHVPGLADDKAAITLHQLLTHTAGVPHGFGPDDEPIDRSDFLDRFDATPLASEPGTRFEYSNVGYALLAAVIEFETGEPYEAYVRTALFEPAGMLDTGYLIPEWNGHTIAVGYDHESGDRFGRPNEQRWDVDGPYWNLLGNGGILSTAADMLRWDEALMSDDILDAAAKDQFFASHVPTGPDDEVHYGYGWQIVSIPMGTPLIKHDGGNAVFYADFVRLVDQDIAVFVATNSDDDAVGDLAVFVADHLLDGALAEAIDDAGDAASDETAGDGDVAAVDCGFVGLSIASLPAHPEIDALPDSPSGLSAGLLLELLAGSDDSGILDFAAQHVTPEFAGDDPAMLVDVVEGLQVALAGSEPTRFLREDDHILHVFMAGPDSDLLVSMGFDENDPERLTCLAVSP